MTIIVDLVIVGILIACISIGYKRGLTGCLIKILSFFIAIVIALILFKPVSSMVINNTQIDENIQSSIVQVFEKEESKSTEENKNEKTTPIVTYIYEEVEKTTQEKKNEVVNDVTKELSINIIKILTFILLFVASRIALIFIKAITNLITKLPLIKQCDKIGGILYGVLQGFVIIFIGCALITVISPIVNQYALLEIINQSYIGNIICNNNILLKLIF
mgnify:FL=1|nr:CvpA family protein [Clostridia bacterium]